jgi:Icc protein
MADEGRQVWVIRRQPKMSVTIIEAGSLKCDRLNLMLIAHITDFHVRGTGELMGGRVPTDRLLAATVRAVNAMDPAPDLVIGTGDLVNDGDRPGGAEDQYRNLAAILAELRPPALLIPGNHDNRAQMRSLLGAHLPNSVVVADEKDASFAQSALNYVVDSYPVRIIAVDTTIPGVHHGEIGRDQIDWLGERLEEQPQRPTVVIQHHPPFVTGIEYMDEMGLRDASDLEQVIAQHPQVLAVLCGHLHRSIVARFAQTVAITAPSTGAQLALRLNGERFRYSSEAPAIALHLWDPGDPQRLRSHLVAVDEGEIWMPDWVQNSMTSRPRTPPASSKA